jgi:hypothetical protein
LVSSNFNDPVPGGVPPAAVEVARHRYVRFREAEVINRMAEMVQTGR